MKTQKRNIWQIGIPGVLAGLFILIGGVTLVSKVEAYELKIPLGLDEEAFKVPKDNPMTKEKVELGRLLFFDKRLSANSTIACASCHIPALAFTDGQTYRCTYA